MARTLRDTINNENGSVIVIALLTLAIVTFIGIAANSTSETELQIAGNQKFHKFAFYAAEAARGFVTENPDLYGTNNITVGGFLHFPNNADFSEKYALGSTQSLSGDVEYLGSSAPPRGSGYEAGKFKAHWYKMTCDGYGPSNAQSQIEAGFYRIGF